MNTRKEKFKKLREELKEDALNECKEELILIGKYIQKVYRRFNKNGKYLTICLNEESIRINNSYYDDDKDFPIDIYLTENED